VILHHQIFELRESSETDEHQKYVAVVHSYLQSLKTFKFENDICNHDTLQDIQRKILDILENKFYHKFVVSHSHIVFYTRSHELNSSDQLEGI
jgi:hypothetical protein